MDRSRVRLETGRLVGVQVQKDEHELNSASKGGKEELIRKMPKTKQW